MRKQNSTFKTAFISEAGSELKNNDYFAFVELEQYACYVIADGLNDLPDAESARLATQSIILAFQAHPSMTKRAVQSYLEEANQALFTADCRERLKASVTVIVTDYAKVRYGHVGNTRLRLYRDGSVLESTQDMSLGTELVKEKKLTEDVLSRHEERNNLYSYLGIGKGLKSFVSKKKKLINGDILAFYTRGIWENLDSGELDDVFSEAKGDPQECLNNVEDLLLSRQPENLDNYTFAAIFIDKVFLDPDKKSRIKKIITIAIISIVVILVISLALWLFHYMKQKYKEDMERRYTNTIEYIQDNNFVKAEEECKEAVKLAEKLRDKKQVREFTDYQKLIEAINIAEDAYSGEKYEDAQTAYVKAKERSRYADRIADEYIDKQLGRITDYLSVFDYIQLGDTLVSQGDYKRAEEKYLQAKSLATRSYFEKGRKEAMDALEAMYTKRDKAEEADTKQAKDKASDETGAAQLAAEGDKAFADGDYQGAKAYYAMALEKYQQLKDDVHGELIQVKIASSDSKAEENEQKKAQAQEYVDAGREEETAGNRLEAKKQYLFAKSIYKELKLDDKVEEVDGLIEILETAMEQEKEEREIESKAADENESQVDKSKNGKTDKEGEKAIVSTGPGSGL